MSLGPEQAEIVPAARGNTIEIQTIERRDFTAYLALKRQNDHEFVRREF